MRVRDSFWSLQFPSRPLGWEPFCEPNSILKFVLLQIEPHWNGYWNSWYFNRTRTKYLSIFTKNLLLFYDDLFLLVPWFSCKTLYSCWSSCTTQRLYIRWSLRIIPLEPLLNRPTQRGWTSPLTGNCAGEPLTQEPYKTIFTNVRTLELVRQMCQTRLLYEIPLWTTKEDSLTSKSSTPVSVSGTLRCFDLVLFLGVDNPGSLL